MLNGNHKLHVTVPMFVSIHFGFVFNRFNLAQIWWLVKVRMQQTLIVKIFYKQKMSPRRFKQVFFNRTFLLRLWCSCKIYPHRWCNGQRVHLECGRSCQNKTIKSEFESRSDQTKDYTIGICCFSAKYAALRRKSKDWLAQNQDNLSEWATCLYADCCFSELALLKSN